MLIYQRMDWGFFAANAGENTLLREETVYPRSNFVLLKKKHLLFIILFSTRYYYLAMAEDIIFRLLWVLGLVLKQVQHHYDPIDYDLSWIRG